MSRQIVKKTYYRIEFRLMSPLAVGSGENAHTDKDIIRDSLGRPYIPATAIAGVCSSLLGRKYDVADNDGQNTLREYLGYVDINRGEGISDAGESRIVFYDGTLFDEEVPRYVSVRDSVALDEYKTAIRGAKFDMEVLEPGCRFVTFLEQNYFEEGEVDFAREIADLFLDGEIQFGAKSTRGYGAIKTENIRYKSFHFGSQIDGSGSFEDWLNFDLYKKCNAPGNWGGNEYTGENIRNLEVGRIQKELILELEQQGGISIRRYTTTPSENKESQPDYEQLTVHKVDEDKTEVYPTIPGTSWAGAFRHHMKKLGLSSKEEAELFGFVKGEGADEKARSKIRFSESPIKDAVEKKLSRNAIDRFSGGTVDGALFTEKTYYGGATKLVISLPAGNTLSEMAASILAATIADLHFGILAVGGETSIGRGLFSVKKVNGVEVEEKENEYCVSGKNLFDYLREVVVQ